MSADSFYWHDYETFGANPRADRPCQFAGLRTDLELRETGDPLVIYCRPTNDYLPHPEACLITGITPQDARRHGVPEPEFCAAISEVFSVPGTCGIGYNSIRFDDEVTRHLLYRNFFDPYAREYANGNSRWDLIDVVRLCYALRPEGIQWPTREDGSPSFKLEHLADANGLASGQAHDALNDVRATIALARLIRSRQPRLFNYCFEHRRRQQAATVLDVIRRNPVLHVSARYPARRGCLAMVMPVCVNPTNSRAIIVYDLSVDPTPMLTLNASDIADRVFTPSADLPDGVDRIPLKSVNTSHAPVLVPVSVLKNSDTARIHMEPERCLAHREQIAAAGPELSTRVQQVFDRRRWEEPTDPEQALYSGGFASAGDKRLIEQVRRTSPGDLAALQDQFENARYRHLLFRYRARHHPEALGPDEAERWLTLRREKLTAGEPSPLDQARANLQQLRQDAGGDRMAVLDQLESYYLELEQELLPV